MLIGPYNQSGTRDLEALFETKVFDFPKPVDLIKYFASFVVNGDTDKDYVVLDFFASAEGGAHATAQAVFSSIENAIPESFTSAYADFRELCLSPVFAFLAGLLR